MMLFRGLFLKVLAVLALTATTASADWGTIKGQVTMKEGFVPKAVKLDVNKDQAHCLSKGDILAEKWVVDPKSRGVKWVMVWIAVEKDGKSDHQAEMEIHPDLKEVSKKPCVIDQPCCKFEPHLAGMRVGQDFVGKNSSPIPHNMLIQGGSGVNSNPIIAPSTEVKFEASKWKAHYLPTSISCSIHNWMNAKLFVFNHPYFVITDEQGNFELKNVPAGKLRLLVWHEGAGWGAKEPMKKGSDGKGISVEAGKTLDLGKIELKYSED
jgi:hypothetical protein